jgi:hypothetical protein
MTSVYSKIKRKAVTAEQKSSILLKQSHKCFICNRILDQQQDVEIDHVVPLWAQGADTPYNMQALHIACHQLKTRFETSLRSPAVVPGNMCLQTYICLQLAKFPMAMIPDVFAKKRKITYERHRDPCGKDTKDKDTDIHDDDIYDFTALHCSTPQVVVLQPDEVLVSEETLQLVPKNDEKGDIHWIDVSCSAEHESSDEEDSDINVEKVVSQSSNKRKVHSTQGQVDDETRKQQKSGDHHDWTEKNQPELTFDKGLAMQEVIFEWLHKYALNNQFAVQHIKLQMKTKDNPAGVFSEIVYRKACFKMQQEFKKEGITIRSVKGMWTDR